jgi:hypothetical protein
MEYVPFDQRLGISSKAIITNDFPKSARIGLLFIIDDLIYRNYISSGLIVGNKYQPINQEIARLCRTIEEVNDKNIHPQFFQMPWSKVFEFIERIYFKILHGINDYDINGNIIEELTNITEVREYYSNEISNLLFEEHLGFEYKNGIFNRRGYSKTTQSVNKVTTNVLSDPILNKTRIHYLKALQFYGNVKTPDFENAIKEAICAVEACLITLFSPEISKSFENIRKLIGNEKEQSPAPIIESIIKLYGYRNSGDGVAHATNKGLKVTEKEAELVISLSADYITYLYSLLKTEENVPF